MSDPVLLLLRGHVADIMIGSVFLFVGMAACAVAGIRRLRGTRIFAWLGIWSTMYGAMHLSQSQAVVADVSGHGVPAALIASMVKVALQTVVTHATEPGTLLRG